jgi:hypothetical protein
MEAKEWQLARPSHAYDDPVVVSGKPSFFAPGTAPSASSAPASSAAAVRVGSDGSGARALLVPRQPVASQSQQQQLAQTQLEYNNWVATGSGSASSGSAAAASSSSTPATGSASGGGGSGAGTSSSQLPLMRSSLRASGGSGASPMESMDLVPSDGADTQTDVAIAARGVMGAGAGLLREVVAGSSVSTAAKPAVAASASAPAAAAAGTSAASASASASATYSNPWLHDADDAADDDADDYEPDSWSSSVKPPSGLLGRFTK